MDPILIKERGVGETRQEMDTQHKAIQGVKKLAHLLGVGDDATPRDVLGGQLGNLGKCYAFVKVHEWKDNPRILRRDVLTAKNRLRDAGLLDIPLKDLPASKSDGKGKGKAAAAKKRPLRLLERALSLTPAASASSLRRAWKT